MPDVYTRHPEKIRRMLDEHQGDISCGIEPRILTPRQSEWTCSMRGDGWYGETYIHPTWSLAFTSFGSLALIFALLLGLLIGYRWGRSRG